MASLRSLGWTDDFAKFRAKVEPFFGRLEDFAIEAPDVYAHLVLSHGFMEYEGIRKIGKSIAKRVGAEKGFYDSSIPEHYHAYLTHEKQEYLKWARQNNLPENLLELGWNEYLED